MKQRIFVIHVESAARVEGSLARMLRAMTTYAAPPPPIQHPIAHRAVELPPFSVHEPNLFATHMCSCRPSILEQIGAVSEQPAPRGELVSATSRRYSSHFLISKADSQTAISAYSLHRIEPPNLGSMAYQDRDA